MNAPESRASEAERATPDESASRTPAPRGAAPIGPAPRVAVAGEVARALVDGVCLVPRVVAFAATRDARRAEVTAALARPTAVVDVPVPDVRRDRALCVFVACAEVSGEVHAVNLVRALHRLTQAAGAPPPRFLGLGGDALRAAGVDVRDDPVSRAQMGLGVWSSVPWYAGLLVRAARTLREEQPDALVAVDSPALHVPLARLARRYGVPVVHFVTPQYWGWAPWRVRAYRRAVDRPLSILPFEPAWYARHGVDVTHVGHPLLDALAAVPATRPRPDARSLVLLPGSRSGVIARNLPWMLTLAARLRQRVGDVPVVVAHERESIAREIRGHLERAGANGWARLASGDLHATLADARSAISVSGTVLLDLLHHRLPTLVVYRLAHRHEVFLKDLLLSVPWFSSVNLLAGREVYPEFCFAGDGPLDRAVDALHRLHAEGPERDACATGLDLAAERLGPPGACERAARVTLALAGAGARTAADRA